MFGVSGGSFSVNPYGSWWVLSILILEPSRVQPLWAHTFSDSVTLVTQITPHCNEFLFCIFALFLEEIALDSLSDQVLL